jgi:cytochrome P450
METCLQAVIETNRRHPGETVVSELLHAHPDGRPLTDEEILSTLFLLLPAALEPPAHLLSLAVLLLAEQPELRAQLQQNVALIPGFVDEVLRCHTDQAIIRQTTAAVTLRGVQIPQGAIVAVLTDAANRDVSQFASPDTFDSGRGTGAGLSFGHGIHYCVGSALARIEGRVAIEALLADFASLTRAGEIEWQYRIIGAGPARLPLQLVASPAMTLPECLEPSDRK